MLDGLMVYGDHYNNAPLLQELHTLLKCKYEIDMHFVYKRHERTVLDDMPATFDETVVLGDEWHMRKSGWSAGLLFNINNEYLHDATGRTRILAACYGQGEIDGLPITWECAGRKLWSRAGLDGDEFEPAWAEAKEAAFHDGNTLRHYSRSSDAARHLKICEHALGLVGRTNFREDELRDYFLKAVGDDVLCLSKKQNFLVWNHKSSGSRTLAASWPTSS